MGAREVGEAPPWEFPGSRHQERAQEQVSLRALARCRCLVVGGQVPLGLSPGRRCGPITQTWSESRRAKDCSVLSLHEKSRCMTHLTWFQEVAHTLQSRS